MPTTDPDELTRYSVNIILCHCHVPALSNTIARGGTVVRSDLLTAVVDEEVGVGCGDVVGVDVGDGEVVDALVLLEFVYRLDLYPGAG